MTVEQHRVESTTEEGKWEPPILGETADDVELVAAILDGDRKATAEFVIRYSDRMFGYV